MASSRAVFISYSRKDGLPFARQLSDDLSRGGHRPWRDEEQLATRGGEAWEGELTAQLLSAELVVVVLTPEACVSPIVKGEFMKARDNKLTVVPALFLDCDVPVSLTALQYLDFREDPVAALKSLLTQLDHLNDPAAEMTRLQETVSRLEANRARAASRGTKTVAFDAQIHAVRSRIEAFSRDVNTQAARVTRGLEEEKNRVIAENAPRIESGVRHFGRRPPTAVGDTFHDRVDQQQTIIAALADPKARMISVLGRGGMGKSALACCVLSRFEEGEPPGNPTAPVVEGIAYLHHTPTQSITLDRVLLYIARVLPPDAAEKADRIFGNRDLSTEERIDRFLELMPGDLIIALLDNVEDLLDERGRIRDADLNLFVRRALTDHGTLRLLVTARAAINLDADELRSERQITLRDGLPDADAIALLRELDPNRQLGLATASEAELRQLVEKTYGIPRALQLVPNILKGDQGAGLLQGLSELANDFWVRENVVENLVEVNYRNLRPEARRVAETLAVFARPVPKVAVDFLLQPHLPGLRLEEVLQPLVNARLVYLERGSAGQPTTLGLHRIDRDFLYQRLPTEGTYSRTTLHHRAAEFYRTQRTAGPRGWSKIIELQPQIFEYGHLVQAGDYDAAAILLGEYADAIAHCGHPTQVRDLYLTLPDRLTSDRARISHELTALIWKSYLGPISEGLKAGEHALELATALQDLQLEVQVRSELAIAYRYASDGIRSGAHAERIAAIVAASPDAKAKDPGGYDEVSLDLVLAYTYQGDVRRAAPLARQLYEVARQSHNPALIATALNALVILNFAWRRYAEAVRLGRESEAAWKPHFHDGIAYMKNIMGMSMYLLGDYPSAVTKLGEAVTTANEWGSPRPEALALWNLSLINLMHGVNDAALRYGRDAEVLMTRLGIDRSAYAPRVGAEAAIRNDHAGMVQALLAAAREWTRCADLFPGPKLAHHAGQIARLHQLDALAAEADALAAEFERRVTLPDSDA
jgi:hypothetical protein